MMDHFKEDIVSPRAKVLSNVLYVLCWVFIVLFGGYALMMLQVVMLQVCGMLSKVLTARLNCDFTVLKYLLLMRVLRFDVRCFWLASNASMCCCSCSL